MSVRQGLLAILEHGPCYGSQLRAEYLRRTGATVNVGQVYTTLERLERDGLVVGRGIDDDGHVLWGTTTDGAAAAREWLLTPAPADGRDEVALKIALAVTLPGADVAGIVSAQRAAVGRQLDDLSAQDDGENTVSDAIVRAARRARLEADLRWLDEAERLAGGAKPFGLSDDRPRRGRPVRAAG